MPHQAVIFDLDGLMLDTERMAVRAFETVGRELGFELTEAVFGSLIGRTAQSSVDMLLEIYGADFPLDRFRARSRELYAAEVERSGIPVKRGLEALLASLRAAAIPFGVATSSARERAWWKLARTGLDRHFEVLVGGDQVEHGKPAPDIFLLAARALGVPGEACIALEDSPAGIEAATAAGMTAIMVPDLVDPDPATRALTHAVVEDLHAARVVIHALVGR